jgi:hypothetical protein
MNISWSGFHLYSRERVKRFVPTFAGVYVLWEKLQNGNWLCIYVGQASDLEASLLGHLENGEQNDSLKKRISASSCAFEYARLGSQEERDGAEKFLYDHYNPECNQVDPGRDPIEVNLP